MMRGVFIIGLTGSIGMGKSTAAGMLRDMGLPVFDADATVHALMTRGGEAVPAIDHAFPGVVVDGAVDRGRLGAEVFGKPERLKALERILHPLVGQAERRFVARAAARRCPIACRDVPLLFETGGDKRCDMTLVVSAPPHIQASRVLARPGMTRERLDQIRAKQMSDAEKRRRADVVVPTGLGRRVTRVTLARVVRRLRGGWRPGRSL